MILYRPCHDAFCRYCHGLTGSSEDARDLVGDAVLVALENFEKLRKKESFKACLVLSPILMASSKNPFSFREALVSWALNFI